MYCVRFLFLLFSASLVNSHIIQNTPDYGENVIFKSQFDYQATIRSTVESYNGTSSGFTINGKFMLFKIKFLKEFLLARFHSVAVTIESNNKTIDHPERNQMIETMEKPFMIHYGKARVIGVHVERDDVKWSVDIKKGISTLFQIDPKQIDLKNTKPYAFYSDEFCLMDMCQAFCTIHPGNNSNFIMTKNMKYPYRVNPVSIFSDRSYAIQVHPRGYSVTSIDTVSNVVLAPINGLIDVQKVVLKQKLLKDKISVIPDESIMTFLTLFLRKGGRYHSIMSEFIDIDYPIGSDEYSRVDKTLDTIKNIYRRLTETKIDFKGNFVRDDENFMFAIEQIKHLKRTDLETCFFTLHKASEGAFLMFMNILPYVGSEDSLIFIYDLITNKTITDVLAVNVLERMILYQGSISKRSLIEFLKLHKIDNLSDTVKSAAILASASIISKLNDFDEPEVEKIISEYVEEFMSSKEENKLVYLCALRNTNSKIATEAVERIIFSSHVSPHIRSLAMWSANHRDMMRLNAIYWPFIEDTSEDVEVRLTALILLMSNPENLFKLYWVVKDEPELCLVYYSKLKSILKTPVPNHKMVSEARKILNTFPKLTVDFDNRVRSYDYFIEKYGIGGGFRSNVMGDLVKNGFVTIFLKFWDKLPYSTTNTDAFYLYISVNNVSKNNSLLSNIIFGDTVADFVWMKNDFVVHAEHLPFQSNFEDIMKLFMEKVIQKKFMDINYKESREVMFPTDLGLPIVYFVQAPEIKFLDLNMNIINQTLYNKLAFKQFNHHSFGLKVYNPFKNHWHGTRRNHILNVNLPFDYAINHTSILINNIQSDFGIQSFVYNEAFMNNQVIKTMDTREYHKDNKEILWKGLNNLTGVSYKIGFYECENKLLMTELKNSIFNGHNMDWDNLLMISLVAWEEFWSYISLLPTKENCGFAISGQFDFETAMLTYPSGFQDKVRKFESTPEIDLNIFYEMNGQGSTKRWKLNFVFENGRETKFFFMNDVFKDFDTKQCFKESKITIDPTDTRLNIFYGENKDGTCPNITSTVEIIEKKNTNGITLMIKYKNVKEKYLHLATYVEDLIRSFYSGFFVRIYNRTYIEDDSLMITFENNSELTNIHITKPSEEYVYRGVSMNVCQWIECSNYPIEDIPKEINKTEKPKSNRDICDITATYVNGFNGEHHQRTLSFDIWEFIVETKKSCNCKLFAKKNDTSHITLRVDICEDKLVLYRNESFVVSLNDKELKNMELGYYIGSNYYYKMFRHPAQLMFFSETCGLNFTFDGRFVSVQKLLTQNPIGICYPVKINE